MIRAKQKEIIGDLLTSCTDQFWKILVLDNRCRNILASLLTVNELRKFGVTINLSITGKRERVEGVPIVYFIENNKENMEEALKDIHRKLYDNITIIFSSKLSKNNLQWFAEECKKRNLSTNCISRVLDTFLDFQCLEENFFSLERSDMFFRFHGALSSEEDIRSASHTVSEGIYCLLNTLGYDSGLIKCQKDTAGEFVGRSLDSMIQKEKKKTHKNGIDICIIDRSTDLIGPLRHGTAYNAIVKDILEMKDGKVKYIKDNKTQFFDLSNEDWLWEKCSNLHFADATEEISKEFTNYRSEERLATKDDEGEIRAAVFGLSDLLEKKRVISGHLGICEAIMNIMQKRVLSQFFDLEEKIMAVEEDDIISVIKSNEGTEEDRLRLLSMYLLSRGTPAKIKTFENILGERKPILLSIKRIISFLNKAEVDSDEKGLFKNLFSSVKTFMPSNTSLPCTKKAEKLIQDKSQPDTLSLGPQNMKASSLLVFIIGGATYSEWNDIKRNFLKSYKNVFFGSTELLNGETFLSRLEDCS
eukprot:GHVP01053524.1.p1 GENE.GHVP01053524.1~~GHVP01053524.1.p1  ORF type:complete len:530 (-),score=97.89 GHVP01053524.1:641-2230(-)